MESAKTFRARLALPGVEDAFLRHRDQLMLRGMKRQEAWWVARIALTPAGYRRDRTIKYFARYVALTDPAKAVAEQLMLQVHDPAGAGVNSPSEQSPPVNAPARA